MKRQYFWFLVATIVLGLVAEHANAGTYEVPGKDGQISGDLCEFWLGAPGQDSSTCHPNDVNMAMIDAYDRIIADGTDNNYNMVDGPCAYPVNDVNTPTQCMAGKAMGTLLRHFRDLLAFSPNAQLVETAVGELLSTFGDYPMPKYGDTCRMYGVVISICTVDNVLSVMENYERNLVAEKRNSKVGVPFTGSVSPAGALAVLRFDREQLMLHAGLRPPVLASGDSGIK